MDRGQEHRNKLKASRAIENTDDCQSPPLLSSQPQPSICPPTPPRFKSPDPKDPSKLPDVYRQLNNPFKNAFQSMKSQDGGTSACQANQTQSNVNIWSTQADNKITKEQVQFFKKLEEDLRLKIAASSKNRIDDAGKDGSQPTPVTINVNKDSKPPITGEEKPKDAVSQVQIKDHPHNTANFKQSNPFVTGYVPKGGIKNTIFMPFIKDDNPLKVEYQNKQQNSKSLQSAPINKPIGYGQTLPQQNSSQDQKLSLPLQTQTVSSQPNASSQQNQPTQAMQGTEVQPSEFRVIKKIKPTLLTQQAQPAQPAQSTQPAQPAHPTQPALNLQNNLIQTTQVNQQSLSSIETVKPSQRVQQGQKLLPSIKIELISKPQQDTITQQGLKPQSNQQQIQQNQSQTAQQTQSQQHTQSNQQAPTQSVQPAQKTQPVASKQQIPPPPNQQVQPPQAVQQNQSQPNQATQQNPSKPPPSPIPLPPLLYPESPIAFSCPALPAKLIKNITFPAVDEQSQQEVIPPPLTFQDNILNLNFQNLRKMDLQQLKNWVQCLTNLVGERAMTFNATQVKKNIQQLLQKLKINKIPLKGTSIYTSFNDKLYKFYDKNRTLSQYQRIFKWYLREHIHPLFTIHKKAVGWKKILMNQPRQEEQNRKCMRIISDLVKNVYEDMEHIKNSYLKFVRDRMRILYEANLRKDLPCQPLISQAFFIQDFLDQVTVCIKIDIMNISASKPSTLSLILQEILYYTIYLVIDLDKMANIYQLFTLVLMVNSLIKKAHMTNPFFSKTLLYLLKCIPPKDQKKKIQLLRDVVKQFQQPLLSIILEMEDRQTKVDAKQKNLNISKPLTELEWKDYVDKNISELRPFEVPISKEDKPSIEFCVMSASGILNKNPFLNRQNEKFMKQLLRNLANYISSRRLKVYQMIQEMLWFYTLLNSWIFPTSIDFIQAEINVKFEKKLIDLLTKDIYREIEWISISLFHFTTQKIKEKKAEQHIHQVFQALSFYYMKLCTHYPIFFKQTHENNCKVYIGSMKEFYYRLILLNLTASQFKTELSIKNAELAAECWQLYFRKQETTEIGYTILNEFSKQSCSGQKLPHFLQILKKNANFAKIIAKISSIIIIQDRFDEKNQWCAFLKNMFEDEKLFKKHLEAIAGYIVVQLIDEAEKQGFSYVWKRLLNMKSLSSLTQILKYMIVKVAKPNQPNAWKELTANTDQFYEFFSCCYQILSRLTRIFLQTMNPRTAQSKVIPLQWSKQFNDHPNTFKSPEEIALYKSYFIKGSINLLMSIDRGESLFQKRQTNTVREHIIETILNCIKIFNVLNLKQLVSLQFIDYDGGFSAYLEKSFKFSQCIMVKELQLAYLRNISKHRKVARLRKKVLHKYFDDCYMNALDLSKYTCRFYSEVLLEEYAGANKDFKRGPIIERLIDLIQLKILQQAKRINDLQQLAQNHKDVLQHLHKFFILLRKNDPSLYGKIVEKYIHYFFDTINLIILMEHKEEDILLQIGFKPYYYESLMLFLDFMSDFNFKCKQKDQQEKTSMCIQKFLNYINDSLLTHYVVLHQQWNSIVLPKIIRFILGYFFTAERVRSNMSIIEDIISKYEKAFANPKQNVESVVFQVNMKNNLWNSQNIKTCINRDLTQMKKYIKDSYFNTSPIKSPSTFLLKNSRQVILSTFCHLFVYAQSDIICLDYLFKTFNIDYLIDHCLWQQNSAYVVWMLEIVIKLLQNQKEIMRKQHERLKYKLISMIYRQMVYFERFELLCRKFAAQYIDYAWKSFQCRYLHDFNKKEITDIQMIELIAHIKLFNVVNRLSWENVQHNINMPMIMQKLMFGLRFIICFNVKQSQRKSISSALKLTSKRTKHIWFAKNEQEVFSFLLRLELYTSSAKLLQYLPQINFDKQDYSLALEIAIHLRYIIFQMEQLVLLDGYEKDIYPYLVKENKRVRQAISFLRNNAIKSISNEVKLTYQERLRELQIYLLEQRMTDKERYSDLNKQVKKLKGSLAINKRAAITINGKIMNELYPISGMPKRRVESFNRFGKGTYQSQEVTEYLDYLNGPALVSRITTDFDTALWNAKYAFNSLHQTCLELSYLSATIYDQDHYPTIKTLIDCEKGYISAYEKDSKNLLKLLTYLKSGKTRQNP